MSAERDIVVIGGSSGIGLEIARKYAADGENVVITSRDIERGQRP